LRLHRDLASWRGLPTLLLLQLSTLPDIVFWLLVSRGSCAAIQCMVLMLSQSRCHELSELCVTACVSCQPMVWQVSNLREKFMSPLSVWFGLTSQLTAAYFAACGTSITLIMLTWTLSIFASRTAGWLPFQVVGSAFRLWSEWTQCTCNSLFHLYTFHGSETLDSCQRRWPIAIITDLCLSVSTVIAFSEHQSSTISNSLSSSCLLLMSNKSSAYTRL
jgi:hypothetical protein